MKKKFLQKVLIFYFSNTFYSQPLKVSLPNSQYITHSHDFRPKKHRFCSKVEFHSRGFQSCRICHIFTKRFSPKFAVADTRRAPLPSVLKGCGTQSTQRLYGLPLGETTHFRLGLSKILPVSIFRCKFQIFDDSYLIFQQKIHRKPIEITKIWIAPKWRIEKK